MIVVHFPSWFPFEGRPHHGNFILRQIDAAGMLTTSIVLHHSSPEFDNTTISQYQNIIFRPIQTAKKCSKTKLISAYRSAFQNIIKEFGKPDLIHLHVALPLGPIAAMLSRQYGIPLVISEHWSLYKPMNRPEIKLKQRLLLNYTFHTAKFITTVSEDLHKAIVETFPYTQNIPHAQISNVVNTTLFAPAESYQTDLKEILHISTLDNKAKNIIGMLQAIQELKKERNDFIVNIIHDLSNEEVEKYIAEHDLTNQVHLLGEKNELEVAQHLQRSAFLLQFSNYENQPCVLLEAFCCGKPVLTTPVGGIPEIANADNALFVEPQNELQLVEKLNYMLDHYTDYDTRKISIDAQKRYAANNISKLFYTSYQTILSK